LGEKRERGDVDGHKVVVFTWGNGTGEVWTLLMCVGVPGSREEGVHIQLLRMSHSTRKQNRSKCHQADFGGRPASVSFLSNKAGCRLYFEI
jgi:hypothetical protein